MSMLESKSAQRAVELFSGTGSRQLCTCSDVKREDMNSITLGLGADVVQSLPVHTLHQ